MFCLFTGGVKTAKWWVVGGIGGQMVSAAKGLKRMLFSLGVVHLIYWVCICACTFARCVVTFCLGMNIRIGCHKRVMDECEKSV